MHTLARSPVVAFFSIMAGVAAARAEQRPSFDCGTARLPAEQAICADSALAELDVLIARRYEAHLYDAFGAEADGIKSFQRSWLKQRNACGADRTCLERTMRERAYDLAPEEDAGPPAGPQGSGGGCRTEPGGTRVCGPADRELRVIADSTSPDGSLAFAWALKRGSTASVQDDGRSGKFTEDFDAVENFLVRLDDGAVLTRTASRHFGDNQRYNHTEHIVRWSPSGSFVVETSHGKWQAFSSEVLSMEAGGDLDEPFDLLAFAREATEARARRDGFKPRDLDELSYRLSHKHNGEWSDGATIDDSGLAALRVTAWNVAARDEVLAYDMTIRIHQERGLSGEVMSLRRVQEPDE